MKKIIFCCLVLLSACNTFERDFAKDVISDSATPLKMCEIEGDKYRGLNGLLNNKNHLKVLVIHGVGTHHPGYSDRLQLNLMNQMSISSKSRLSKNITIMDPVLKEKEIGHLRVTEWADEKSQQTVLFYELTWSEITQPYKNKLSFDTTEQYSAFRVPFNNTMKAFFDNTLPDPMVYLTDPHQLILHSSEQALCWMLKTNWQTMPNSGKQSCTISMSEKVKAMADENITFITHSLGSEIVMDTLTSVADEIAQNRLNISVSNSLSKLQQKEMTVFLMANQLPILLIDKPLPKVHNQIKNYCQKGGAYYQNRVFKRLNVVAFTDPNDLLSYAIPQSFADTYLDSRICPFVTNALLNVAPEISAFGIGIVNPISAHVDYQNSPKVIQLITNGTNHFEEDAYLRQSCHFIQLKDHLK